MKTCHLEFLLHYDKTQGEQVELLVPHIQDVLSFFYRDIHPDHATSLAI